MALLNFISILFLLIASGCATLHQLNNRDAVIEKSTFGSLFLLTLSLAPILIIMFNIIEIVKIKWYWSLLLAIGLHFLIGVQFAKLYSKYFGFKSKPYLNFMLGVKDYRSNLYYKNFVLSFVIGIITFAISNI